jgi:hypothetical protein
MDADPEIFGVTVVSVAVTVQVANRPSPRIPARFGTVYVAVNTPDELVVPVAELRLPHASSNPLPEVESVMAWSGTAVPFAPVVVTVMVDVCPASVKESGAAATATFVAAADVDD